MANLNGDFYPVYKKQNSSFNPATFTCAEETVEKLLETATTSDRPGILLGKVQSGKTRTFISILALAFDNGYDIAIVLSKNSKALIEQTAKRLKSEFKWFLDDEELSIYDIMSAPEKFSSFELESKLILLAKKQSDNLRRLIRLFDNDPAMSAKRTLIIDDEADSASIGYTQKQGIIEANKIAKQVSELRSSIQSSSFLQVTANALFPLSSAKRGRSCQCSHLQTDSPSVYNPGASSAGLRWWRNLLRRGLKESRGYSGEPDSLRCGPSGV